MDDEENLDAAEAPDRRRFRITLVSGAALALSVAALLVSLLEVSAIRAEQRVQVWPYVQLDTRYSADGYAIVATNKGIGPARVRIVEISFDGDVVDDLDQLIVDSIGAENAFSYELYKSSNPTRSVMSADERISLFAVPWEERTRRLAEVWTDRVSVELCYCSVYDDCWQAQLDGGEPSEVQSCTWLSWYEKK